MSWPALSLVSDADLGALEPQAIHPDLPWGELSWPDQRAEAKRDLRIWIELDYPDLIGVADRVIDRWAADYVFGYTGAAYSDITTAAKNDTEDDVVLSTVLATPGSDRLYVGAAWTFDGLEAVMTGTRNANTSALTVNYSGPTGWTSLTVSDGTASSSKTFAKSGRITWTAPSDWQRERFNGTSQEFFWIELIVSAALTSGTSVSGLLAIRPPDGLRRCATYLALGHIYNGLASQSPGEERWRQQADKYFVMAKDLYQGLKARSALWLDVDRSSSLTAGEAVGQGGHVFYRA